MVSTILWALLAIVLLAAGYRIIFLAVTEEAEEDLIPLGFVSLAVGIITFVMALLTLTG